MNEHIEPELNCYYHPSINAHQKCVQCNKILCERCVHDDHRDYCWSCGLAYMNGDLPKKRKVFKIPARLSFIKKKSFLLSCAALIFILCAFIFIRLWPDIQLKQEMTEVQFNDIHLFMNRQEVGKLYGLGSDKTEGCFGCELNFIFPKLKLSGRYSETLGGNSSVGMINTNPQVKMLTTADSSNNVFGIRVGDTLEKADRLLEDKGFTKEGPNYHYVKGLYYIDLWYDDGKSTISSLTIGYRVKGDERIVY
ncbi:B-box zinc finger protein [Cohnella abietis]|uniref:B box-type domain-containing protein n=1 Tax=Cohnella abietis TaxID=2507935 RepID=A0A3T1D6Q1_9BACL|nr:hypothetical protein [Cohnella abietis]BBI33743.1 hypothetical protein KCTCHS21_31420 [Cohnella abietis]